MMKKDFEKNAYIDLLEQDWFPAISKPSRYMGNEINAIKKDPASVEVSIALAFPDIYEIGMSHLGLKILYKILNRQGWLAAERAFCPWVDLEKALVERSLPLTSIESGRPLFDFDIIGFSIQNELAFTNVLTMLSLSRIPFLSGERGDAFPLIIAGGPACFNPEPIAPLFDAIVIGDGENAALEICRIVREMKSGKRIKKKELLLAFSEISGVYIPSFFEAGYNSEGTIKTVKSFLKGYEKVRKSIIPDIDNFPFPTDQVVPFTELVHDRLAIEISRGCTRGCRFCQAGMIYRPVRERDPKAIMGHAEDALTLTGFTELSLLSLSSGDYSCIGPLLEALMEKHSHKKIAVSFPSLRVDSLNPEWFEQIKKVRKTGFTLAPEAGNDRLRRVINKDLTDRDILRISKDVYEAGWNLIKLYFMIGLPGETEKDLLDIVTLSEKIVGFAGRKGKKPKLNVSLATFVPKSHTPFMWVPQTSLDESNRRMDLIKNSFRKRSIRVKWNQASMSWLEGIFSRGDRRLNKALIEAWNRGARFDAWSEHYDRNIWLKAFERVGLDPDFYLIRSRSPEETFPWDHIHSGVSKGYLKKEWKRALAGEFTSDCRESCHECGVCDHEEIDPVLFKDRPFRVNKENNTSSPEVSEIITYRITFTKTGPTRFLSHLELVRLFIRAFKRMDLDIVYSNGYHPMPKISFSSALPVGTESLHETLNLKLYNEQSLGSEDINKQLPEGINVIAIEKINPKLKSLRLKESCYEISKIGFLFNEAHIREFLGKDNFPLKKRGNEKDREINARALVKSMSLMPNKGVHLILKHGSGPSLKPAYIIKGVFNLSDDLIRGMKIVKTKEIFR